MMISLKTYFEDLFSNNSENNNRQHTVELATAVLMLEISLADDHIHDDERNVINELLVKHFGISDDEIKQLIKLAETEVDHAVSLHDFTRLLNDELDAADKANIIENLWHVAFADSVLDKYEEYYIRKVADLLYVPHSDYIKAKLKAENSPID